MRIFLLFIFVTLFACNKSSNTQAYEDYIQAKQNYIKAILDSNKPKKISSLKEIIECGKFLGFDVSKYQTQLTKLRKNNVYLPDISDGFIKVLSTYPKLKISLPNKAKVVFFTLHKKNKYYKIFDIYNAKVHKPLIKTLPNKILLKIAQNNKHKVRVVLIYHKNFTVSFVRKPSLEVTYHINSQIKKITYYKPYKINRHRIIVIDPGHGGKDPGAIGQYHIKEKDIVLPMAKYLKYELLKRGYKVYLTRNTDRFITLRNRTKFANKKHADLFISLHCNIAPHHPRVYGIETYFLSPARSARAKRVAKLENSAIGNLRSTTQNIVLNFLNKNRIIDSTKLAIDIQKSLIYNLKKHYKYIKDGGVRPAPFWVLVGTNMPAILIETGFISNKLEARRLDSYKYQKRYAKYIADGIDNYFRKNP
ncbi:MAG: N-acetylmuramoyl-L-alanine amidase [Epsilonproteobacteria bacterium]|nr:N-acetylmuramoyl-L-alanine amidase [Campylobacterota bacterium]